MIMVYINAGIIALLTLTVFYLLRKLNTSIETLTFMIGKFAEVNQDVYTKQNHISKTIAENLEKQNKQLIELNTYRREMDRTKTSFDETAGNIKKLVDDVNSANRKFTESITGTNRKLTDSINTFNKSIKRKQ